MFGRKQFAPQERNHQSQPAMQRAVSHKETARPESDATAIMQMQHMIGNRALQRRVQSGGAIPPVQRIESGSGGGLPDGLKAGVESLSGMSMDDVKVHYNSSGPAALNAHAYAQGSDIHVGPGQEKHLPHEAWHVVQQKQGRVQATTASSDGTAINDSSSLESEADRMGSMAASRGGTGSASGAAAPSAPSVGGGSGGSGRGDQPAQLVKMSEVIEEQRTRIQDVRDNNGRKRFMTVGFEWDVAHTRANTAEDDSNFLEGLTHVELAESSHKMLGLPYLLETDAGNTLEFVTPPFLIQTRSPDAAVPLHADLKATMDAMQGELAGIVQPGIGIGDVMGSKQWGNFGIANWNQADLHSKIEWRNWSWRAKKGTELRDSLYGDINDVKISDVTVSQLPQINMATTADVYREIETKDGSRVGENPIKDSKAKIFRNLFGPAMSGVNELEPGPKGRILNFLEELSKVLAQQEAVPHIRELSAMQQTGFDGGDVNDRKMAREADRGSFIKDATNVWLKTDLISYGFGVLRPEDWSFVHRFVTTLLGRPFSKFSMGESEEGVALKELMGGVLVRLRGESQRIAGMYEEAETADDKGSAKEKVVSGILAEIGKKYPKFNEHNDDVLGVRQDTFIKPQVLNQLNKKLNFDSLLYVLEVRNTTQFLKWLIQNESKAVKKKAKTTALAEGSATAGDDEAELLSSRGGDSGDYEFKERMPEDERKDDRESDVTRLAPVGADAYDKVIGQIRSTITSDKVPIDGDKGEYYADYAVTPEQIATLGDRKLLPTVPDGDCSINAVLESLGRADLSPRELRAQIANAALERGSIAEEQGQTILQPGDWSQSHIMLPWLADLLDVRVRIIIEDGSVEMVVGREEAANGEAVIYFVQGSIGHYYGSR